MVVVTPALADTQRAFDGVAGSYDRSNAANPILCAMRARVQATLAGCVPVGAHLLDLGCGPGSDATDLAAKGYRVTAIDWSPAMVEEARRRVHDEDVADRVDVQHIGIHELDRLERAAVPFDAAYSNFGPLNCVVDLRAAARRIADRLKPGGVLLASVIGRICPWEIALCRAWRSGARGGPLPPRSRSGAARRRHRVTQLSPREFETISRPPASRASAARARPVRSAAVSSGVRRSASRPVADRTRRGSVRRMARAPRVRRSLSNRVTEGLSRVVAAFQLP